MSHNKRIIKNSLYLYLRMLFLTVLTLYTSRVVLEQLGIEDYGIYNIVGGIVTMLAFFNSSMLVATQRYMAFDIGKNDYVQLNKTFSSSIIIYIAIAVIVILLLETIGLWYVNYKLVFPSQKVYSVNVVYQLTILTFIVNIVQLPYNALVLAKEKMGVYALVTFVDSLLKLGILYLLFLAEDKLVFYSFLVFLTSFMVQIFYVIYCNRKFKEINFFLVKDKEYLKELLSFSSWSLFGNVSAVARNQGINLVLNMFFGLTINTTYAIAILVQNAIGSFGANFQKALNPPIIKSYAQNEKEKAFSYVELGCKFTCFLLLLITVPIFVNVEYILKMWLGEYPILTPIFVRLAIIVAVIESISGPLMTLVQATGRIKYYQIVLGSLVFLNLPIAYFVFKTSNLPYVFYYTIIVISVIAFALRLYFLKKLVKMNITLFFTKAILPVLLVCLVIFIFIYFIIKNEYLIANSFIDFLEYSLYIVLFTVMFVLLLGLSQGEKRKLISYFKKV